MIVVDEAAVTELWRMPLTMNWLKEGATADDMDNLLASPLNGALAAVSAERCAAASTGPTLGWSRNGLPPLLLVVLLAG